MAPFLSIDDLVAEIPEGACLAVAPDYSGCAMTAVRALLRRHSIADTKRMVVIHDEADLVVGRLKLKCGGGNAGHNGLRSIEQHIHTNDFVRIRIGVGRPPGRQDTADYLLRRPSKSDRVELDIAIEQAADAAEYLVDHDVDAAMAAFNAAP